MNHNKCLICTPDVLSVAKPWKRAAPRIQSAYWLLAALFELGGKRLTRVPMCKSVKVDGKFGASIRSHFRRFDQPFRAWNRKHYICLPSIRLECLSILCVPENKSKRENQSVRFRKRFLGPQKWRNRIIECGKTSHYRDPLTHPPLTTFWIRFPSASSQASSVLRTRLDSTSP